MDTLDIVIEEDRWHSLIPLFVPSVEQTLIHAGLRPNTCELSILACDDLRIAALNTQFRDKPTPTNVLSWPAEERAPTRRGTVPALPEPGPDGQIELGDIAISFDTCTAEAAAAGKPISAHVTHLIVHGVLHLLGYDHIDDADAALMEGREVEILGKLGLDDPY
ncbi:rRNA maturation RNase YbeY [Sulfitobacter aestuariivivens]|uniref:Endoribonuclease YbeY n=1 Tax=Sulfitobacter aestuariivivens TaxID=2766981 RepID=A0A927D386_9RHOB|nr:rRNA maturation RNase YbeY [Sulfitobacter aestuariivivens]MBD3664205.1 rRNA maturation RNase YbeY [Sulfitobacter aestuariivivens]